MFETIFTIILVILIGYGVLKILNEKGSGVAYFMMPWKSWRWYAGLIVCLFFLSLFS